MTAAEDLVKVAREHPLYENIRTTKGKIVIGRGEKESPEYLFIGEYLDREDNIAGKPFSGKNGKILNDWIKESGIKSYTVINTLPIIPLDSENSIRLLTQEEIEYFRPYIKALIKEIKPKRIICLGKSVAKFIEKEKEFKNKQWSGRIGYIYTTSFFIKNGKDGITDFAELIKNAPQPKQKEVEKGLFKNEVEFKNMPSEEAVKKFISMIGGNFIDKDRFTYGGEKWFVDYHPFAHSDDIIIHEDDVANYDKFLLVKTGSDRVRIPGFTDRAKLISTPKRDIYRNGKYYYIVHDTNVNSLVSLQIPDTDKILKTNFLINQQKAENLGHTEMISGILAGLHSFAKQSGIFFKDINQKDECILGENKVKIYTRDAMSDEDMLIYDEYYQKHPEITLYVCCKIKAGNYNYIGYIDKAVVDQTRIVQMIGSDSNSASNDIRRIFAEQYKNLSDFIKIYETEKKEEEIIIPQSYVPLHVHCEFSIGDAFGTTKYLAETAYKKGFKAITLTDHGTLAGTWEFKKNCLEKNIKPILGCEIYMKREGDDKRYHLGVLVKNEQGWKNLLKLHSMAVRDNFYYKPIVLLEDLFKYKEGLIILSGCTSSLIHTLIRNDEMKEADALIKRFKDEFGDDFYAEMQVHNIIETRNQEVLKILFDRANHFGIKSVITTDSHYPKAEDKEFHDAIKAIDTKKPYGTAGYGDDCFYLMEDKDIEQRIPETDWKFLHYKDFMKNTFEVSDKCNFQIKNSGEKDTLPKIDFGNISRADMLKKMAIEGLEKNTPYKYDGKIKERLDLELNRFIAKGYENYFLMVADMIRWAKTNGISVGPCRGSAGASLAAYALNITEVDPIEHDLLFDRFISEIRRDAPDIDVDYMDIRKDEMYKYLCEKYGKEHCAKVATYARFHPKGILRDVGRIFKIPLNETEKVCSMVLERSGGDARASFGLTDTFAEFAEAKNYVDRYPQPAKIAMALEGHIRHRGIHAAAVVATEREISSYLPITKIGGEIATEWEKQLCEDIGLIKFDILGLQTLTIIKDCIDSAGIKLPTNFNDEVVYKNVFWKGNTVGIFQFSTVGMTKFSQSLNVETFNDLYDATTLFRPGALHCVDGQTAIKTEKGEIKIKDLFYQQQHNQKLPNIFDGKGNLSKAKKIHNNGEQECFELIIDYGTSKKNGRKIICTDRHRFFTKDGWKMLSELKEGDKIFTVKIVRGYKKGHDAWSKGLSADTDYRVKRIAEASKNRIPPNKGKKMNFTPDTRKMLGDRLKTVGIFTRYKKGSKPHNKGAIGWGAKLHEKYPDSHPNYILNKNGRISYKQKEMFNEILKYFPDAVLNLRIKTKNSFRFLDVAVPSKMYDFEYDGEFWHKPTDKNIAEEDRRNKELNALGWRCFHITKNNWNEFIRGLKDGFY